MDGGGGSGGRVSMATTQHLGRSLFRAGSFLFLSPHFVFIYSALLFLFRRRGYILLARLIVASDVLVQTTCHERDGR